MEPTAPAEVEEARRLVARQQQVCAQMIACIVVALCIVTGFVALELPLTLGVGLSAVMGTAAIGVYLWLSLRARRLNEAIRTVNRWEQDRRLDQAGARS